jgi:uroporphyrinogen decarboxylase
MDSKERFHLTIERKQVDRNATWLGYPDQAALPNLFTYYGVGSMEEFKIKIDDDIWPVDVPYSSPFGNHIADAFDFRQDTSVEKHHTLTDPGFFQLVSEPAEVEKFKWPEPSKYIDVHESKRRVNAIPCDKIAMGMMWSAHFQDACSAFGMETALIKMYTEPDMFKAVLDRITKFYLEANAVFYEATKGQLDAVLIGNDFGTQSSVLVEPALIEEMILPGTTLLVEQAHAFNLKVIHHSCGSVFDLIPAIINTGTDVIHPIQALAKNMEPWRLKENFGDQMSFCGGVDAQELLINGSPEMIRENIIELRNIFPTGLIISPSHEAILPDINPANIDAMLS